MLPYFILGIAVLVGVLLIMRWYVSADPKTILKVLKWLSLGIIVVVGLFLAISGRFSWAMVTLPALFGWFMRFRSAAQIFRNFSRMAQGRAGAAGASGSHGASEVETRFLRMSLDHASGDMDGEVLEGPNKGSRLGQLDRHAVVDLFMLCRGADQQSAQILEAYLDRRFPDWREDSAKDSAHGASFKDDMDRSEALDILGLAEGATPEQIKQAHHRLIAGIHPDHGGSTYLAAKINRAKDVLLS